jgi:hypothetical protein
MENDVKKAALIFLLIISGSLSAAAEMTVAEWNQLNTELTAYLTEYADLVRRGEARPLKSGTPFMHYLVMNRPRGATAPMLLFERRDDLPYTYGTDHFLLHYTDQGIDSVYHFDIQNMEPGYPDYIVMAGQTLEYVYQNLTGDTLLGHLGFDPPLSDGYYNGGGDGRFDVYFTDLPYYGATVVDSILPGFPITSTTYIFLENDYDGFTGYEGDRNILALDVTAAHELFHSVQFSIDLDEVEGSGPSMSAAWMEMSAVFMEEEHYTIVNDYYNYMVYFYAVPQWSLRTGYQLPNHDVMLQVWKNLHMYGSSVWPIFLKTQFGSKIIREIWEACGDEPGFNWLTATDQAIRAASDDALDLREMYRRFTLWNLFTGNWARPGEYFPEGDSFPRVTLAAQLYSYPETVRADLPSDPNQAGVVFVSDSARPDNLGANYILLNNVSSMTSGLAVSFNPDISQPWAVTVVGLPANISDIGQVVWVDPNLYDSSTTSILIPNAADFNRVALILAVTGGNQLNNDYSLSVTPLEEMIFQPNGGEIIYVGTSYPISWFFADSVTTVVIELSIDNGQNWDPIATVDNGLPYEWTVPNTPSDSCLMRVVNADNSEQSDTTDGVFSIRAVGANRILAPFPNPAWVQIDEHVTFKAEQATASLGEDPTMTVTIFNIAGEKIRHFPPQEVDAGSVVFEWDFTNNDGRLVSAGPYLAVIEFAGQTEIKKFFVLR